MRASPVVIASVFVLLILGALVAAVSQEPGGPTPWLHVEIANDAPGTENGGITLPVGAVMAVLSMAPNTVVENGQLQVGPEHGVSVGALRDVWRELRRVGDSEVVSMQHGNVSVQLELMGERVDVRVAERVAEDDKSDVTRVDVPAAVLDALLSGDGETLNIDAALETLSTLRGDIVHVTENDREIRVWIDEMADQ